MAEIGITDVINFIDKEATRAQLRVIFDAGNARYDTLRRLEAVANMDSMTPGTRVSIKDIKPKYLIGMTGTFVSFVSDGVKNSATIELDPASWRVYSSRRHGYAEGHSHRVSGIPMSCLQVVPE